MTGAIALTRRAIVAVGGLLVVCPVVGQTITQHHIAVLSAGASLAKSWKPFNEAMRDLGYGEEQLHIDWRYAEGYTDRLPTLAADLVRLAPEIIVTASSAGAIAAKQATSSIPIVTIFTADPVGTGLAASLARPGGNVTGLSNIVEDTAGKNAELLKTAVPRAVQIAVLENPGNPSHTRQWQVVQNAAQVLGLKLLPIKIRAPDEVEPAFVTARNTNADALIVLADPLFLAQAERIADLAARERLPAIYGLREHVVAGGLMSYGPDFRDSFRRAALYVDKILKGASPAELPFEQPTKIEFVINRKVADALGLELPRSLLQRADEVIE